MFVQYTNNKCIKDCLLHRLFIIPSLILFYGLLPHIDEPISYPVNYLYHLAARLFLQHITKPSYWIGVNKLRPVLTNGSLRDTIWASHSCTKSFHSSGSFPLWTTWLTCSTPRLSVLSYRIYYGNSPHQRLIHCSAMQCFQKSNELVHN